MQRSRGINGLWAIVVASDDKRLQAGVLHFVDPKGTDVLLEVQPRGNRAPRVRWRTTIMKHPNFGGGSVAVC